MDEFLMVLDKYNEMNTFDTEKEKKPEMVYADNF